MGYDILSLVDSFSKFAKSKQDKYQEWIEDNVKYPRDGCFFYSATMALLFPELTLIRGKHSKQRKDDTCHFFLRDDNGNEIDPTAKQYPEGKLSGDKEVSAIKNIEDVVEDFRFKHLSKHDKDIILSKMKGVDKVASKYPKVVSYYFILDLVKSIHHTTEDLYEGDLRERIFKYEKYILSEISIDEAIKYSPFYVDKNSVNDIIENYSDKLLSGDYPPIIFDPDEDLIIDGTHRIRALKDLGVDKVIAYIGKTKMKGMKKVASIKNETIIMQIASNVRKKLVYELDSENLNSFCLEAANELRAELQKKGIKAIVVQGTFEVDNGIIEDDFEEELFQPLHYWVEVQGKVLDITGSQFQEFVNEDLPEIAFGNYNNLYRYNPIRKGWGENRKMSKTSHKLRHISDPDLFNAVARIEGERWAEIDKRGGVNSLTDLIKAYYSYLEVKDEYNLDKFDAEIASLFDHSGVVYGEGGMSRWVIRNECLVLDGNSTHKDKKEKAKAEGFSVLE